MNPRAQRLTLFVLALGLGALAIPSTALAQSGPDADLDGVPNEMDAFPCEMGPSAVRFFPGQGQFATMFFEDQWPSRGDNDFNDVVASYNFILVTNAAGQVYQIRANYNVPAVGGVFDNGLALRIPVPVSLVQSVTRQIGSAGAAEALNPETTDAELVVRLVDNVRQLYGNQAGTINSDPERPARLGTPLQIIIRFTEPVAIDLGQVPFDTFIFRSQDFSHQIHRPEYVGTAAMDGRLFGSADDGSSGARHFVDQSGLPFALLVPASTPWPREGTPISQVFPQITSFAASGGVQGTDFYQSQVQTALAWTQGTAPAFVGAADEPGLSTCIVPWVQGGKEYGGTGNETTWHSFASDSAGNVLAAGNVGSGVFLTKFSASGPVLWSRTWANEFQPTITVDSANNIFVASSLYGYYYAGSNGSIFQTYANLRKYDSNGTLLWTRTHIISDNPSSTVEWVRPTALAMAPDGSLMMTGLYNRYWGSLPAVVFDLPNRANCYDVNYSSYAFTAKMDSANGNLIWARAGDSATSASMGTSLAVDSAGNSYTYVSHISGPNYNMGGGVTCASPAAGQSLIKRDPNGAVIYRVQTDNVGLSSGGQVRLSGETLVLTRPFTGTINGQTCLNSSNDFAVQKVSAADGHQIWIRTIGTAGSDYGYAGWNIASPNGVDPQGNIYVAGSTNGVFPGNTRKGTGSDVDYFLSKLDASGTVLWTIQYGTDRNDYATGVGWEPLSNTVYVGGQTQGAFPGSTNAGGWDVFLMKHNPLTGGVL